MAQIATQIANAIGQATNTPFDPDKLAKLRHPMTTATGIPPHFPLATFHLAQLLQDIFNPPQGRQAWSFHTRPSSFCITLTLPHPHDALIQITLNHQLNNPVAIFVHNGKTEDTTTLSASITDDDSIIGWLSMIKTRLDESTPPLVITQLANQSNPLIGPGIRNILNSLKAAPDRDSARRR